MSTCITEPLKNIIIPLLRLNMHYQSTAKTTQHFAEAIHTLNTTVILTVLVDIMNKRLLCRETTCMRSVWISEWVSVLVQPRLGSTSRSADVIWHFCRFSDVWQWNSKFRLRVSGIFIWWIVVLVCSESLLGKCYAPDQCTAKRRSKCTRTSRSCL